MEKAAKKEAKQKRKKALKKRFGLLLINYAGTTNSTYKKLAAQWLIEAMCFVSISLLADSFLLRNRQLLLTAKR